MGVPVGVTPVGGHTGGGTPCEPAPGPAEEETSRGSFLPSDGVFLSLQVELSQEVNVSDAPVAQCDHMASPLTLVCVTTSCTTIELYCFPKLLVSMLSSGSQVGTAALPAAFQRPASSRLFASPPPRSLAGCQAAGDAEKKLVPCLPRGALAAGWLEQTVRHGCHRHGGVPGLRVITTLAL